MAFVGDPWSFSGFRRRFGGSGNGGLSSKGSGVTMEEDFGNRKEKSRFVACRWWLPMVPLSSESEVLPNLSVGVER